MKLKGKNAIVTGAAAGIGLASAQRLLSEGANVLVVDVNEAGLEWVKSHPNAVAMTGSIADAAVNQAMVAEVERLWGPLSIVHLNAAAIRMGSAVDDGAALSESVEVNIMGTSFGIRSAARAMIDGGGGAIIITNSTAGLIGDAAIFPYAATKAGVLGMVRAAAADLAPHGIRVNAICPGPIATAQAELVRQSAPELHESFRRRVPMQRWGKPEEVAGVVAFLASEDAAYITGAAIPVDGGLMATSLLFPLAEA